MTKYKICVYAICKNEEKFVDRWVKSMMEADDIYVLDTGSTDNTVKKLEEYNVHVSKDIIKPWRFDVARNKSLELIPNKYDIYVCTDLDEVFLPGWRKHLEDHWSKDYTRVRYNYNWSLDKDDKPLVNFYLDKIHIYGYTQQNTYICIHTYMYITYTYMYHKYVTQTYIHVYTQYTYTHLCIYTHV